MLTVIYPFMVTVVHILLFCIRQFDMPVVSLICNMQCYYYMSFNYLSAKKLPKMCQFALQESSKAVIMGSIY